MAKHVETLVIGGGPAGLTTAYTLAKAGRGVTVLEMDPTYVGGISRTVDYKGFKVDIGGHRFASKSQEIVDLWNEILPDGLVDRPALSRIYYREKFYAYPLKAFEALANLGVWTAAKCTASFGWAKLNPITAPTTFHQWVRNQFGETLFSIFFKTYAEKVWGMSCDEISADWAGQRIKGLHLGAAILDGLKRSPKAPTESFRYPRKGPGMMWDACADKITALGGEVRLGRKVDGLHYDKLAKIWTVSVTCADGKKEIWTANDVVSSAPIRELMQSVSPTPISVFHAGELMYRDFITVALIGKPKKALSDSSIYIHDPSVKAGRVQNFRAWSSEMIPDETSTCLGLEYFCFEGDGLWVTSDEDLVAIAKREIGKIGLMDPADVRDACVVRQHKAYPVYDDAYAEHIKMIRLDLKMHFPGLHLVGRNGMHKYNNQDHAMMTGVLTAENIVAGEAIHDVWEVSDEAGVSGVREALGSLRPVAEKVAA
ncbi:NAD(P)/FAD-dependent oxidoreductase [Caulobacter sp.]|uniref:NAD(P)/FAD-dependent oxidoreductase n=1 Tax=Caulobacter sp. TaxID=78 RepID=UPI001AFD7726|nr:NAD(P)/FAD-dependent oxidoreductase [Caulobacter sp.]MBO9546450.1 NAD(P)/FAD-dependent oxidoreductase [Caulobacter sp.]